MKKLVFRLYISDITPLQGSYSWRNLLVHLSFLILSFLFHLFQFLSNLFKYSFLNFPLFHSYNILAIYFPGSSALLKFFSSAKSNFSCLLTSVFILFSNSVTNFFVFSKSFFFSQLLCSTVNLFHCTEYFITPLTCFLFKILSTSHSLTLSISIGLTSSFLCLST